MCIYTHIDIATATLYICTHILLHGGAARRGAWGGAPAEGHRRRCRGGRGARGGRGGDRLGWGHPKKLYNAPTDYTSPDKLYKAPEY